LSKGKNSILGVAKERKSKEKGGDLITKEMGLLVVLKEDE